MHTHARMHARTHSMLEGEIPTTLCWPLSHTLLASVDTQGVVIIGRWRTNQVRSGLENF